MQVFKKLLAVVTVGILSLFLFIVGLGFMLFVLMLLLLAGLFFKPQTYNTWRQKWLTQWRRQFGKADKQNTDRKVIDGQYTVIEPH